MRTRTTQAYVQTQAEQKLSFVMCLRICRSVKLEFAALSTRFDIGIIKPASLFYSIEEVWYRK